MKLCLIAVFFFEVMNIHYSLGMELEISDVKMDYKTISWHDVLPLKEIILKKVIYWVIEKTTKLPLDSFQILPEDLKGSLCTRIDSVKNSLRLIRESHKDLVATDLITVFDLYASYTLKSRIADPESFFQNLCNTIVKVNRGNIDATLLWISGTRKLNALNAEVLLVLGADVNTHYKFSEPLSIVFEDYTPLKIAVYNEDQDLIRFLIAKGASIFEKFGNESALDVARSFDMKEIEQLLWNSMKIEEKNKALYEAKLAEQALYDSPFDIALMGSLMCNLI